jgi:hypothetical protein
MAAARVIISPDAKKEVIARIYGLGLGSLYSTSALRSQLGGAFFTLIGSLVPLPINESHPKNPDASLQSLNKGLINAPSRRTPA